MSKRKTYGEIAYNAAIQPSRRKYPLRWNDLVPSMQEEYERSAKSVLRAYDRRKKYIIKTLEFMK